MKKLKQKIQKRREELISEIPKVAYVTKGVYVDVNRVLGCYLKDAIKYLQKVSEENPNVVIDMEDDCLIFTKEVPETEIERCWRVGKAKNYIEETLNQEFREEIEKEEKIKSLREELDKLTKK